MLQFLEQNFRGPFAPPCTEWVVDDERPEQRHEVHANRNPYRNHFITPIISTRPSRHFL